MLLSERPLYNLLPISSTSASCFFYTFWNPRFTVDKLFDPTDVPLKLDFPRLNWIFSGYISSLLSLSLFLHSMHGVGGSRPGKTATHSVLRLPVGAFLCHLANSLFWSIPSISSWLIQSTDMAKSLPPDCSMSFFFLMICLLSTCSKITDLQDSPQLLFLSSSLQF